MIFEVLATKEARYCDMSIREAKVVGDTQILVSLDQEYKDVTLCFYCGQPMKIECRLIDAKCPKCLAWVIFRLEDDNA